MAGMLIGYARTSTADQAASFEAQQAALKAAGCEKLFAEQASAAAARPQLNAALEFVREGDTLTVAKMDRLARNLEHLLTIVKHLEGKGVALHILDFGGGSLDTKGPQGRLMLTLFGAFAEFERSLML